MEFFHRKLYSSARINDGNTWRLSFFGTGINTVRGNNENALTSRKLDSEQKAHLLTLKAQFLRYLERRELRDPGVDLQFHIGAGVYASVRIPLPVGA